MSIHESAHECTVLLSGGLDSAACVHFYYDQGYNVSAIHLSYGQRSEKLELEAASLIAGHYGISLTTIELLGARKKPVGEVFGRNGLFILASLMETEGRSAIIAVGVHSGTNYFDCTQGFIDLMQSVVNGQCDGRVRISAPFLTWTKPEIWRYCLDRRVPVHLAYSCEAGVKPPCKKCKSCLDFEVLRASEK